MKKNNFFICVSTMYFSQFCVKQSCKKTNISYLPFYFGQLSLMKLFFKKGKMLFYLHDLTTKTIFRREQGPLLLPFYS